MYKIYSSEHEKTWIGYLHILTFSVHPTGLDEEKGSKFSSINIINVVWVNTYTITQKELSELDIYM